MSGYLAQLVATELKRRKAWPVEPAGRDTSEIDQAIAALAIVRASIDELDSIAGRLARAATGGGAPWQDVARPLRLSADVAETAFGGDGRDK